MSPTLRAASFAAVAFCVFAAAVEAAPSIASAADVSVPTTSEITISDPAIISAPSTAQVPALTDAAEKSAPEAVEPSRKFASLRDLVDNVDTETALNRDEECLAGAIYFESKSESLEGQHAVAEVIINRSESGRFPGSICGVVYQPSQFSFVRGGRMPAINRDSRDWHEAVAVARVAMDEAWETSASDALFFHATRVSPRWKLKRVATIGNHVFYR
ncbi:cell wall hydrolase [Sphingomonas cavernae]|uniref:Cell wall hydrolase n=1 Tax=Sphingomonas cavernae TaxID=2320861 RepID=A0A418WR49_9SPHN|nr:cell wall hydrolase [Sphingomonas cavernae]